MKINEKILAGFASSTSYPSDLEGWLVKRGEVNRAFQRRWCVLRGNLLFYSEKPGDKEPLGVIILEGCTVELAEEETDVFALKLVFHSDGRTGRTYVLGAASQEELEKWIRMLACASFDYMKLMVVEMQQKISELELREKEAAAAAAAAVGTDGGRGGGGNSGATSTDPRPPPRARHNPFNTATLAAREKPPRLSWLDTHKGYGERIVQDREEWLAARLGPAAANGGGRRGEQQQPPTVGESRQELIQMTDENLLVII